MELPNKKILNELLSVNKGPCISLYLPTHRTHPENIQDPIRYKNLVRHLKESLLKKYASTETESLLDPFYGTEKDIHLWNYMLDGLAIFRTKDLFRMVRLPVKVNELAIVAESFHTKPLRQYLQSADRFHILGVSLHEIQFYEGNRYSLTEIELGPDIPKEITEALGEELTEKHITFASYGGAGGPNMVHGHGARKEEVDIDAERFFRIVGQSIAHHYSKPSRLPLILAALPEHHNLFQKVNNNPNLLAKAIPVNPKSVSKEKLVKMAWEIIEPGYKKRLEELADRFELARSHGKGSDIIPDVVKAAVEGRVDTLLIEADRKIAGRIDFETASFDTNYIQNPEIDDLLDDIGEIVTRTGSEVLVVPHEFMPSQTGLAAIFRY
jgi:peptide subunit release factor 1 (eRF1)